jgi:nucleoid DNA-binding protein
MMGKDDILMEKMLDKEEFIRKVAKKASFTQNDVGIILDTIIEVFEESARDGIIIKIKNVWKLTVTKVKKGMGYNAVEGKAQEFPETTRVNFKLASNIRMADKDLE